MQRSIRHHIVPRFMLARFADARPSLLVHDLETNQEFETTPKRIAYELDFYTVETTGGPSDAIEQELGKLEAATAEALRRIDAGSFPPTDADRGAIASFMSLQFVRGKDFRDMGDRAATDMIRLTGMVAAAHPDYVREHLLKALGRPVTEEEVRGVVASLKKRDVTVTVSREQHIKTMLTVADRGFPFFFKRKWLLVDGAHFPTTDMPVVLWQRPQEGFFGQGVGLATADEIVMAISPARVLMLVHQDELSGVKVGPERLVQLKNDGAPNLRKRLWLNARRFQFRHPTSPAPG
jgi:hypothetical protein